LVLYGDFPSKAALITLLAILFFSLFHVFRLQMCARTTAVAHSRDKHTAMQHRWVPLCDTLDCS
jgi:predicted benzoate:H+ symporter BenE